MNKYLFNETEVEKELIVLLSILKASNANHKLLEKLTNDNNIFPITYVEGSIIQEYLIATAIKLRIIDDQFRNNSTSLKLPYEKVGVLKQGKTENDLRFRDACNKIIHAIKFLPQTLPKNKDGQYHYYIEQIILKGELNSDNWEAQIDLDKYVSNGLFLLKKYDDDWNISSR